ncbi:MAG: KH domain-containing protein [Patescibacteria group bacterium]
MAEKDQEFVEYMVRSIVNHPDDVRAERTIDERGVLITLHVNPEDMGYVIGREGQTARSLRTLLRIVGAKSNARVNLKIYEPEEARQARMVERGQQPGAATNDAANRPDFSALDDLKI